MKKYKMIVFARSHLPRQAWDTHIKTIVELEKDVCFGTQDGKVSKALRVLKLAGGHGHGAGGKGWKLMRKTVQEEVTSGNNWREWKREEDYEG